MFTLKLVCTGCPRLQVCMLSKLKNKFLVKRFLNTANPAGNMVGTKELELKLRYGFGFGFVVVFFTTIILSIDRIMTGITDAEIVKHPDHEKYAETLEKYSRAASRGGLFGVWDFIMFIPKKVVNVFPCWKQDDSKKQ